MLMGKGFKFNPDWAIPAWEVLRDVISSLQTSCSKQQWYDFGMRKIKAIIHLAGTYLRQGLSEHKAIEKSLWTTFGAEFTTEDLQRSQVLLSKPESSEVTIKDVLS